MRCCFKMTPMYNLMHPKSWRPKIIISWVPICQSSPCISEGRINKTTLKAQNYYEIWEEVHLFKKLSMTQKGSSDNYVYKVKADSVDDARRLLLSKVNQPECLPPTSDALQQYFKRFHYQ